VRTRSSGLLHVVDGTQYSLGDLYVHQKSFQLSRCFGINPQTFLVTIDKTAGVATEIGVSVIERGDLGSQQTGFAGHAGQTKKGAQSN
jgi:hypothetical protein